MMWLDKSKMICLRKTDQSKAHIKGIAVGKRMEALGLENKQAMVTRNQDLDQFALWSPNILTLVLTQLKAPVPTIFGSRNYL